MINPQDLQATLQIGKNGLTPQLIDELIKQLKKRKIVKIKLLRSYLAGNDRAEAALTLSRKADSDIVSMTGFSIILRKRFSPNIERGSVLNRPK